MPLKHHTETAYLVLLACVTAVYGLLLSLLPHFPDGVLYWCVLLVISLMYPLVLVPSFRSNRADYEFRFLHWAPALMTLLWLFLEILARRYQAVLILQLGFLYLWSLPLVVLCLTLILLFCLHVVRRQSIRVAVIGGLLVLFFAFALSAEALGWNAPIQAALFPSNRYSSFAANQYRSLVAMTGLQTSSGDTMASSSSRSASSSSTAVVIASNNTPVGPPVTKKPSRLPGSGPEEGIALLFITLLALYCRTLHVRAVERLALDY